MYQKEAYEKFFDFTAISTVTNARSSNLCLLLRLHMSKETYIHQKNMPTKNTSISKRFVFQSKFHSDECSVVELRSPSVFAHVKRNLYISKRGLQKTLWIRSNFHNDKCTAVEPLSPSLFAYVKRNLYISKRGLQKNAMNSKQFPQWRMLSRRTSVSF